MSVYNPKRYNWITKLWHYLIICFVFIPFYYVLYRLKVYGKENVPKNKKPYIIMPNHLSNLDPPMVSAVLKIPIGYMAKKELYSVPFWGWMITTLGAFSVDRQKVTKTTIIAVKELLQKGWPVCVFLEGTRSTTPGILGKPFLGPAYFAKENKVPILPVGIVNSDKLFGPVTVRIGKLFYPEKDLETAKWQCAKKLSELTGLKLPDKDE